MELDEAGCLAVSWMKRGSRPDKRREYEESDQQRRRPSEGCLSLPSQSQNAYYYFLDKIPSHSPVNCPAAVTDTLDNYGYPQLSASPRGKSSISRYRHRRP